MPTYVYECSKCGNEMEAWQSFSDTPLTRHEGCGGKLVKVLQPVGIVLKGSGFYRTDSRPAAKRDHAPAASSNGGSSNGGSSDGGSSDGGSSGSKDSSKTTTTTAPSKSSGDAKPSRSAGTSD